MAHMDAPSEPGPEADDPIQCETAPSGAVFVLSGVLDEGAPDPA